MSKLKSRKLWAFITWSALIVVGLILGRTVNPELIQWYGTVTIIYIGGQSAIDFIKILKAKEKQDE
jgi:hypothetical protein